MNENFYDTAAVIESYLNGADSLEAIEKRIVLIQDFISYQMRVRTLADHEQKDFYETMEKAQKIASGVYMTRDSRMVLNRRLEWIQYLHGETESCPRVEEPERTR